MRELAWILVGCAVAIIGAARAAFSPCGRSMLASLTPYAEAARGSRWWVTVAAFSVGAIGAGAAAGTLCGAVGSLLPGTGWRVPVAVVVLLAAIVIDATSLRRRLPLTRRQVNEDWMVTYRGWVYGLGFGAQLGFGFITLVACAAIYATFAIALLSGAAAGGAVIGAVFGATKAASLMPAGRARDGHSLARLHARIDALEPASLRAVVAAELAAMLVVLAVAR